MSRRNRLLLVMSPDPRDLPSIWLQLILAEQFARRIQPIFYRRDRSKIGRCDVRNTIHIAYSNYAFAIDAVVIQEVGAVRCKYYLCSPARL